MVIVLVEPVRSGVGLTLALKGRASLDNHLWLKAPIMKIDMRNATLQQATFADVINYFGNVQNKFEVISGLDAIRGELQKAVEAGALTKSTGDLAQAKILEATQEAKSPNPNKSRVRQLLDAATETIKDIE